MKNVLTRSKIVAGGLLASVLSAPAFAAGSLTVPTFDTSDFVAVAGAVLVASVVMWGVKKGLSLIRA